MSPDSLESGANMYILFPRTRFIHSDIIHIFSSSLLGVEKKNKKENIFPQDEKVATGNYLSCEAGSPES